MGYGGGGGGGSGGGGGGSGGSGSSGSSYSESPSLDKPKAGAFRFNTDSSQLEIYDGNQWTGVLATSPEQQTGGTRGLFAGGYNHHPSVSDYSNHISYINVDTTGDATDFGNLTAGVGNGMFGYASRTRGLFGCGYDGGPNTSTNIIGYVTISSTGNAIDFGDAAYKVEGAVGLSNETRGIHAFGFQRTDWAIKNSLQYTTIATTGSTVDSGIDAINGQRTGASFSSPTRGLFAGGTDPNAPTMITHLNINTVGVNSDFGDLAVDAGEGSTGGSNAVRGIYFAGYKSPGPAAVNNIEYITISTLGNSSDFGDSTVLRYQQHGCSSRTRAVCGGGTPSNRDVIEYVQIMSTGNAIDFGDMNSGVETNGGAGTSNGHGGL
tara:strand:+ start:35 stop:1168 length:1134 start_codon:yes stop_codon:yes gene_type:complete